MSKPKEIINTTPSDVKRLRACIYCRLIKTEEQFRKTGCENCGYKCLDHGDIEAKTSENFEGMISMIDAQHSWVARFNKIGSYKGDKSQAKFVAGCYCIEVVGENEEEEDSGSEEMDKGDDEE